MTRLLQILFFALLLGGCTVGIGPNVNPVPDVPDDDDSAVGDDDDATGDDDDSTVGDDDDATGDDDDATGDDDDSAVGDDDDSTVGDDDDSTDPAVPVRFVAMGDTGEGNADQVTVAGVVETVCAAQGCDFILLMGDNIYDEGAEDVNDSLWQSAFEVPYANITQQFYPVLGNHDGGFLGTGLDLFRGQVQVDYSAYSTKWNMPDRYYARSVENVDFFALDTSIAFFQSLPVYDTMTEDQGIWLNGQIAASTSLWKIAYGHHPYLSNGPHGNAGNYEGLPEWTPFGAAGTGIKDFLEDYVCGNVDFYLCGHDHSRQWLVDTCSGTELIVTGGGAKRTDIEGSNPVHWEDVDDDTEGFVWIEILGNTMTVEFWNKNGTLDYTDIRTK